MARTAPNRLSKISRPAENRVLGLDLRPSKVGFVVLEGPSKSKLVDWGVRTFGPRRNDRQAVATRRISSLLDLYSPRLVVLRRRTGHSVEADHVVIHMIQALRKETKGRAITLRLTDARQVRDFFALHSCKTKQQIATLVAEWYPELAWKLPPKRKPWQSEPYGASLFDAAAAVMIFRNETGHERGE